MGGKKDFLAALLLMVLIPKRPPHENVARYKKRSPFYTLE